MVDWYSGWPSVYRAKDANDRELVRLLRTHCETFRVPEELASDGGSTYTSNRTQEYQKTWGFRHRLSSAYTPHGNLLAEVGVKSIKRIPQGNLGSNGELDTDAFSRAQPNYRNTPDHDTGQSKALLCSGGF